MARASVDRSPKTPASSWMRIPRAASSRLPLCCAREDDVGVRQHDWRLDDRRERAAAFGAAIDRQRLGWQDVAGALIDDHDNG